jgi:hypothetical protein
VGTAQASADDERWELCAANIEAETARYFQTLGNSLMVMMVLMAMLMMAMLILVDQYIKLLHVLTYAENNEQLILNQTSNHVASSSGSTRK